MVAALVAMVASWVLAAVSVFVMTTSPIVRSAVSTGLRTLCSGALMIGSGSTTVLLVLLPTVLLLSTLVVYTLLPVVRSAVERRIRVGTSSSETVAKSP